MRARGPCVSRHTRREREHRIDAAFKQALKDAGIEVTWPSAEVAGLRADPIEYDPHGEWISEQIIREALHPYADGLVVATKGGLTRSGPGDWRPVGRPEYLRQQVELSLRHLGVERFRSRDVNPRRWRRHDGGFRVAALAGARTAENEGQLRALTCQ